MKSIRCLFLFLIISANAFAQVDLMGVPADKEFLHWVERPLNREDFRTRKNPDKNGEYFDFYMGAESDYTKKKSGNLSYSTIDIKTIFSRSSSWMVPEYFTDDNLRYTQVIFDVMELYSRRIQNAINTAPRDAVSDSIDFYKRSRNAMIDEIRAESDCGNRLDFLVPYELKVKELLDQTTTTEHVPVIGEYEGGIGLYMSVLQSVFLTDTSPFAFSTPTAFNFGLAFPVKKNVLLFDLSCRFGKTTSPVNYLSYNWPSGTHTEMTSWGIGLARKIKETAWWDIQPYFILGGSNLNLINSDVVSGDDRPKADKGFSISVGTDFRLKYLRFLKYYNKNYTEYSDLGLYGKIFVCGENHSDLGMIVSVNFGLGIDIYSGSRNYY